MNPLLEEKYKIIIAEILRIPIEELKEWRLNQAWDTIIKILNYNPVHQIRSEKLRGNGTDKIYLDYRPVTEILELKVNGVKKDLPKFTERYIELMSLNGIYYTDNTLYNHDKADYIEVSYMGGYEIIPNDLLLASALIYQQGLKLSNNEGSIKSYKIGDISYTYEDKSSNDYMNILRPYRSII